MRKLTLYTNKTILRRATIIVATLALAMGVNPARASTVNETVTISSSPNLTINPMFTGLSYEKMQLTRGNYYFSSTNTAVINLFNMLGSGVVRIGGGTVDDYNWAGIEKCPPITGAEVDSLAGFMRQVPQWKVIYGINFASNTQVNASNEAVYVHAALGSQLLGFEIGNEPDEYYLNGKRDSSFTYDTGSDSYIPQWDPLKLGVHPSGPLVGPATASFTEGHWEWTTNFAFDEASIISMATRHYYGGSPSGGYGDPATMIWLITNNPALPGNISREVSAVNGDGHLVATGGLRFDESGSIVNGGQWGVSDAFGSAQWALDYMFILALKGAQGVNFHGGGKSAYCPIFDNNNSAVTRIGPEYYAMALFSMIPAGNVVSATVSPSQPFYTADGVKLTRGGTAVLLNNKDTAKTMNTTVNLGSSITSAQKIMLTGTSWYQTNGYTLGGAIITTNGTWAGSGSTITTSGGSVTVAVPPYNSFLLVPN